MPRITRKNPIDRVSARTDRSALLAAHWARLSALSPAQRRAAVVDLSRDESLALAEWDATGEYHDPRSTATLTQAHRQLLKQLNESEDALAIMHPRRNPSALHNARALAREFSRILREWLTEDEIEQVIERNAEFDDPAICASHDFCDANMAMYEAFENIMSHPVDPQNPADASVWDKAWSMAKANDFDDDFDDDVDVDDDDYRANPDSALASLMKLASEAMTASGMYGSTIDVDFAPSEAKTEEWAALSNAEQLAPGVWFARYYAVFRYSKALWRKQTPAQRQAKLRTAFLTVGKLYLNEEQRAKASKPRRAPKAAPKKQLKEGEIDHEIVARFRREAAAAEAAAKAPKTFKQPVSWFFKWKPKRGQPGGFNSVQAKTRLEALKKATALGKRDGKTILTPDAASLQLDLDGRLSRGAMSMFSD